jgi:selenide,water dikinase
LIDNTAIVETVDVITPIVNDPFTFGAISANNSLSDIYAMGGRPIAAMAVAGLSSCNGEPDLLKEILRGAIYSLKLAETFLIGGHSFEDPEIKFGLAVTGVINKNRILKVSGALAGNIIVMTKPLGIGILSTALKGRKLSDDDMKESIEWMMMLNKRASEIALEANATSCTDITGFGLLGHALNMVKNSAIDFVIYKDNIPVMNRVFEMIDSGMVPEGAYNNLRFVGERVKFSSDIDERWRLILSDPQTSGGLLITIDEKNLKLFENSDIFYAVIGRVVNGTGKILIV